jgi:hypothetical protein
MDCFSNLLRRSRVARREIHFKAWKQESMENTYSCKNEYPCGTNEQMAYSRLSGRLENKIMAIAFDTFKKFYGFVNVYNQLMGKFSRRIHKERQQACRRLQRGG